MSNTIDFKIKYTTDAAGLVKARQSLEALQNITSSDLLNLDKSLNITQAEANLKKIQQSASTLASVLNKSYNSGLDTINIVKFNEELKKIDLNTLNKNLSLAGASGKTAFKNIVSQSLTANMQLKETNKLVNSMADTFKNTIRWGISSSVINSFTGSIQKAYSYTKTLDRSLNDIRIVTNKSAEEMANFAVQANEAAKSLGTKTTNYTQGALIYAQQGASMIFFMDFSS